MMFKQAIILATICATALGDSGCPSGIPSVIRQRYHNGKCYLFVTHEKMYYEEAEKRCEAYKGTLALPKSQDVNGFLAKNLAELNVNDDVWIGLNDMAVENLFKWEDGSSLDLKHQFNAFKGNEGPRIGLLHHVEDCVAMDKAGLWHDYICSSFLFIFGQKTNYICEVTGATAATTTKTTPTPPVVRTTPAPATTTGCPQLDCTLDCGLMGNKVDPVTGCTLCACEEEF